MQMNESTEISASEAAKMTTDELIEYAVRTGTIPRFPTTSELKKSEYFIFPGVSRKD